MSDKTNTKNFFVTKLLQLQNHIKRDPTSYKDEFTQVFNNFESTLQVYLLKPTKQNKQVSDLAMFLSHVTHCYPAELKTFPEQLLDILRKYATVLHNDVRLTFVKCLMLIRGKNMIEPIPVFEAFFPLLKCPDRNLRTLLYTHMLNDAKKLKIKLKNYKLCSKVQQYVFTLTTKDNHPIVGKYALAMLVDLYKKGVWNDAKTVNVIAAACFCKITKVVALALHFFAGKDQKKDDDSDDSDAEDKKDSVQVQMCLRVGKKTKSRQKKTDRALKVIKKERKKSNKPGTNGVENFSALQLVYDPHDFAEKLFKLVQQTNEGFDIKLAILDLVARLIGIHSLYLSNFHPYLMRFLRPQQQEVTKMLWFTAISSHSLTPPDTVEPVLMNIANNFITERNSGEVIAVGLNAVREICARCPLAMNEDLLGDLVQYRNYKDKSVSHSAKSLIHLFREKNQSMLARKMRGKPTEASQSQELQAERRYGEKNVVNAVPGAEVIDISSTISNTQFIANNSELMDKLTGEDQQKEREEKLGEDSDLEENEDEWEEASDEEEEEEEEEEKSSEKPSVFRAKKRKLSESDDEDWVKVVHSDDEEEAKRDLENGEEDEGEVKLTLEEKAKLAMKNSSERILTQEDFKKIRLEQLKKKLTDKGYVKGDNKNISIDDDEELDMDENEARLKQDGLIGMRSITSLNKKSKEDKAARVARILEGREGRDKFGARHKGDNLGKSNKEKRKTKAFAMIRHKVAKKGKRSFKDKQLALKKSLIKRQKNMK